MSATDTQVLAALKDDAWEGHDEPLTSADLERIAKVATEAMVRDAISVSLDGARRGDIFAKRYLEKIVRTEGEPPTATEAIKGFVSAYIFQLGLVELQDQITNGTLDGNEAVVRERMLRGWIDAKVRALDIDVNPALSANALHQAAADLAQRAVRVLRAR